MGPAPTFKTPVPEKIKPPIPIEISSLKADQLCNKLEDIKVIPNRVPEETDPIYESLILKGDEAIPCLINKITDSRKISDPRYSVPTWQHYAVGDTAIITLLDIASNDDLEWVKLMLEMLPPKAEKEWETNGIYAYFNYVSEQKNRHQLQNWWKDWFQKKKK